MNKKGLLLAASLLLLFYLVFRSRSAQKLQVSPKSLTQTSPDAHLKLKSKNEELAKSLRSDPGASASTFMVSKLLASLENDLLTSADNTGADFTYIFNEIVVTLNMLSYVEGLLTCNDFEKVCFLTCLFFDQKYKLFLSLLRIVFICYVFIFQYVLITTVYYLF